MLPLRFVRLYHFVQTYKSMRALFQPRLLLIIAMLIAGFHKAFAQTTTHSLGASVPFGWRNYETVSGYTNSDAYYLAMFSYGFRHNLSENGETSFSIGPLVSAGVGMYSDLYGVGVMYSGDLQVWGDYNSGMGAVAEPSKNKGWFMGLGFGASYTGADGESIDENNGVSYGPMMRAGFRFGVYNRKKDVYKAMSIAPYYKHGLEAARWRTVGIHILADL